MNTGRDSRRRAFRRLSVPLAVAAAGGLGAGLGLLVAPGEGSASDWPEVYQDPNPTHLWPWYDTGPYTYSSALDECGILNRCVTPNRKDPINIVFHGSYGHHEQVDPHASMSSHGGWSHHAGTLQCFSDHGKCEKMDGTNASNPDVPPADRWHMRYNEGPAWDSTWGWYTVAAAHHEELVGTWPWEWCHAVDSNDDDPPGGFNSARGEIWWKWTVEAGDGHVKTYQEDWGNTQRFQQCDGDYAWSNGIVYHISMGWPLPSSGGGGRGGSHGFGW